MAVDITEDDLKNKGPALFAKLEKDAKVLEVDHAAFEESRKLIDEGKSFLSQGNIPASLKKYFEAKEKISTTISAKGESLASKLLLIEMVYLFVLLLLGYVTIKWPDYEIWKGLINQSLQTAWYGALGGITIAIYGIYSHVQQKDFDPKYKLWYICKPIIGAIFGWFVYLIFFLGLVSVQGVGPEKMARPELPFLIAFLAGFSERFTIKMIDKLMSILISWEGKETESKQK